MPAVYLLKSDELPLPMVPAGLLNPTDASPANPTVFDAFAPGAAPDLTYKLNKNSRRAENIGRYGGGAYAVCEGCDLSMPTGLTLVMSTGAVMMDGPQVYAATKSLAIPDNLYDAGDITVRAHIWLSKTGDLSYRTDLTQPATSSDYLGSVRTSGGAVYDIDYSGRVELRGIPYRRTADAGEPNADLPAKWRGLVRTAGALYWWDGADYFSTLDACTVYTDDTDTNPGNLFAKIDAGDGISVTVEVVEGKRVLRVTNTALTDETDLTPYLRSDGTVVMAAALNMGSHKIVALTPGTLSTDGATYGQVTAAEASAVSTAAAATTDLFRKDGSRKATGAFDMDSNRIKNVPTVPTAGTDAINDDRLTAQLAGLSTSDIAVRVDSDDTTEGPLNTKVTVSRGLAKSITGPSEGDRKFNLALDTHEETLPKFEVVCPPGEERIIRIRFGAADFSTDNDRGSFPDDLPYEVIPRVSHFESTDDPPVERFILEEIVSQNDLLNGSTDTTHTKIKTGSVCFLRLRNLSPNDWDGGTSVQTNSFWITLFLRGVGWVAGASPSADPEVDVFDYSSWHTETFTLDPLTVGKGGSATAEIGFSGLGTFQDGYFITANPANDDASVWVLASGRTGNTFRVRIENASDAASTDVTLTVKVHGRRWWGADDTLNTDTPGDPTASILTSSSGRQLEKIALSLTRPATGFEALLYYVCTETTYLGGTAFADSQARCAGTLTGTERFYVYRVEPGGTQTEIAQVAFDNLSVAGTITVSDGEQTLDPGDVVVISHDASDPGEATFVAITLHAEVARATA